MENSGISVEEVESAAKVLNALLEDGRRLAELPDALRVSLLASAGRLSRPAKDEIRIRNKQIDSARRRQITAQDRQARATTGIREARLKTVFTAPLLVSPEVTDSQQPELKSPRNCYVCKAEFLKLHFFYDSMCPTCADYNYKKRFQTASLKGQTVLITGSRLKIGYQATVMMLRAGWRE
jgi:hypothetical protein